MDAFNGSLTFYVWDTSDPMVRTYQSIFPDLFTDKDEMPESLRSHVRYPQDLFGIQAEKYLRYHMLDPQDFYNLEDIWDIPQEKFGQGEQLLEVKPYYVIMKIPGEDREEFVLLIPYTRNQPPILAGWLAARNDAPNYGELVAFRFPKERQVDSPQQVEAKIDNDPFISQWFTLRCQEGSFCIRGNLLVIPVATEEEFGLLYAEPVYLQAEGIDFPELKQVILATGRDGGDGRLGAGRGRDSHRLRAGDARGRGDASDDGGSAGDQLPGRDRQDQRGDRRAEEGPGGPGAGAGGPQESVGRPVEGNRDEYQPGTSTGEDVRPEPVEGQFSAVAGS